MQMEPATYHSYTDYSPRSITTLNARPRAAAQQSSAQLESTTMHKRMEAGAAPPVSLHRASAAHLQRQ